MPKKVMTYAPGKKGTPHMESLYPQGNCSGHRGTPIKEEVTAAIGDIAKERRKGMLHQPRHITRSSELGGRDGVDGHLPEKGKHSP